MLLRTFGVNVTAQMGKTTVRGCLPDDSKLVAKIGAIAAERQPEGYSGHEQYLE